MAELKNDHPFDDPDLDEAWEVDPVLDEAWEDDPDLEEVWKDYTIRLTYPPGDMVYGHRPLEDLDLDEASEHDPDLDEASEDNPDDGFAQEFLPEALRALTPFLPPAESEDAHSWNDIMELQTPGFHPTETDVRHVVRILGDLYIPTELAAMIIHMADYWPRRRFSETEETMVSGQWGAADQRRILSAKVPAGVKINRIVLFNLSHDQGWASDGGSWTWGELRLVGPERRMEVYRNQSAEGRFQFHHYILEKDAVLDEDIESLEVYQCAAFPGWVNITRGSFMEVYYSYSLVDTCSSVASVPEQEKITTPSRRQT